MAVLTDKTLFLHIGRTGGHSVSHALWRAGLVEERLQPLHIRPVELVKHVAAKQKPFWFCFVRHPIEWLASVWMHMIAYGVSDHTLPLAENFPDFLDKLLLQHPAGIVTERLSCYVDVCHFVGKMEQLERDLHSALRTAGETFDERKLCIDHVNSTSVRSIRQAARAPYVLLEAVMTKDLDFVRRFGYDYIPQQLINEETLRSSVLPRLSPTPHSATHDPTAVVFDPPRWAIGGPMEAGQAEKVREFWSILAGLHAIERPEEKSLVHISAGDGLLAYFAASMGFRSVAALDSEFRSSINYLRQNFEGHVEQINARDFRFGQRRFDVVLCTDFFASRVPALHLSILASLLAPAGELILHATLLRELSQPFVVPVTPERSPHGPLYTMYMSWSALSAMLAGAGFRTVVIEDDYDSNAPWERTEKAAGLAATLNVDPELPFREVTIRATQGPDESPESAPTTALEDGWWRTRPLWQSDARNSEEAAPLRRLAAHLREELNRLEPRLNILRGALADREIDLAAERRELIQRRSQVDAVRLLADELQSLVTRLAVKSAI